MIRTIQEGPPRPKLSVWERFPQLKNIPNDHFPGHVLIIPDGNRRHARDSGLDAIEGHRQGLERTITILRDMRELPIGIVTLWAFSTNNWKRPPEEVDGLFTLLERGIQAYLPELQAEHVRFVHLGRKDRIPAGLRETIADAEESTMDNTGQIVCIAIDFGGEDQDVRIVKRIARDVKERFLFLENIDEELIKQYRDGEGLIPPADLIIRTSENRTSGIGWPEGEETQLYFIPGKLYPEIDTADIVTALVDFSGVNRRLGA